MNDKTVAYTILSQLGGNLFCAMIGVSANITHPQGLMTSFKAKAKNRINGFRITLQPDDTYKVEFLRAVGGKVPKIITVSTYDGIYADVLVRLFESETGLAAHL